MSITLARINGDRNVQNETKDAAQAVVKDTFATIDSTGYIPATSSTTRRLMLGIFKQTITAGEALTTVDVERLDPSSEYVCSTTNNSNILHNGQAMVLTNAGEVNNTGTTSAAGVVIQTGVLGAAADKKITVRLSPSV